MSTKIHKSKRARPVAVAAAPGTRLPALAAYAAFLTIALIVFGTLSFRPF